MTEDEEVMTTDSYDRSSDLEKSPLPDMQRVGRGRRSSTPSAGTTPPRASEQEFGLDRYHDVVDDKSWRDASAKIHGDRSLEKDDTWDDEVKKEHWKPSSIPRPYATPTHRPLTGLVRNVWLAVRGDEPLSLSSPALKSSRGQQSPDIIPIRRSRLVATLCLLLAGLWLTFWWLGPMYHEQALLEGSLRPRLRTGRGWFGLNMRPKFAGMVQLKTLDSGMLPGEGMGKRLIVVGDVHGCKDELVSLLDKLSFHHSRDHLILAGDLVSKGPSSPAVVSLAISLNASCVRGNHEDRVLLARREIRSRHIFTSNNTPPNPPRVLPLPASPSPTPNQATIGRYPNGANIDRDIAASLTDRQTAYLAACPVILNVGRLHGMGHVAVVHAGLVPGVSLQQQDPSSAMNMRAIDLATHVPSRKAAEGVWWPKLWNRYQAHLRKGERSTVIYGHDSGRGLQLTRWTKGLDTGCVKGGRLTALVIGDGGGWWGWGGKVRQGVVSVECRDYRV